MIFLSFRLPTFPQILWASVEGYYIFKILKGESKAHNFRASHKSYKEHGINEIIGNEINNYLLTALNVHQLGLNKRTCDDNVCKKYS